MIRWVWKLWGRGVTLLRQGRRGKELMQAAPFLSEGRWRDRSSLCGVGRWWGALLWKSQRMWAGWAPREEPWALWPHTRCCWRFPAWVGTPQDMVPPILGCSHHDLPGPVRAPQAQPGCHPVGPPHSAWWARLLSGGPQPEPLGRLPGAARSRASALRNLRTPFPSPAGLICASRVLSSAWMRSWKRTERCWAWFFTWFSKKQALRLQEAQRNNSHVSKTLPATPWKYIVCHFRLGSTDEWNCEFKVLGEAEQAKNKAELSGIINLLQILLEGGNVQHWRFPTIHEENMTANSPL